MIPVLNMSKITEASGKPEENTVGNGILADIVRIQPDVRSSTPLRNRSSTKGVSRVPRDPSPSWATRAPAAPTVVEDSVPISEMRRRAEDVSSILGVNILQVQDIFLLQYKAIEVAERLIRLEEWYKGQLQERSSYLEHRMAQLAASTGGGQRTPSVPDKLVTPTTIRHRQSPNTNTTSITATTNSVSSRPTLNVGATTPTRRSHGIVVPSAPNSDGMKTRSPEYSRINLTNNYHNSTLGSTLINMPMYDVSSSRPTTSSRQTPTNNKRQTKEGGGSGASSGRRLRGTGTEKRKLRSASLTLSRGSRGSSEAGTDEPVDDANKRQQKRRSLGSSISLSVPVGNATPKRIHPSSGRLGYLSETTRCD